MVNDVASVHASLGNNGVAETKSCKSYFNPRWERILGSKLPARDPRWSAPSTPSRSLPPSPSCSCSRESLQDSPSSPGRGYQYPKLHNRSIPWFFYLGLAGVFKHLKNVCNITRNYQPLQGRNRLTSFPYHLLISTMSIMVSAV